MAEIIYLAGPYSRATKEGRLARFEAITIAAARLIEQKKIVFSPLTMTHPIDLVLAADGETLGSEFWVDFDEAFVARCDSISVLQLPGWDQSSGVTREIAAFESRGITPVMLAPSTLDISANQPSIAAAFDPKHAW